MSENPKIPVDKKDKNLDDNTPHVLFFHIKSPTQAPRVNQKLNKRKPYVFFGKNNLFPQRLVSLMDNSAIHSSIVDAKTKFVKGNGWVFEAESDTLKEQAQEKLNEVVKGFETGQYLDRVATDQIYFNGYYLNVVWETGGAIGEVRHKDFTMMRSGKTSLEEKRVLDWWLSTDWEIATRKRNFEGEDKIFEPMQIPAFDPNNITNKGFDKEVRKRGQLWSIRSYKPSKWFYAEPVYLGALNWIDIEGKVSDLHINNLDNGMVGSQHIHLHEDLSDVAKRIRVENSIQEKFGGSNRAGTIAVTWSTDPELAPSITPIENNNNHEMFALLSDHINAQIIASHRIPKVLTGLEAKTGLNGQSMAIRESLEYFQSTVISPNQRDIQNPLNEILKTHGIDAKVRIANLNPIQMLGDAALIAKTTFIDEYRTQVSGLPELEEDKGKVIIDPKQTIQTTEPGGRKENGS